MVEAKCVYFGKCGGCTSQHVPYSVQLENKKKELMRQINFEDVEVFSGDSYFYRNRMDFIFHSKGLGLRAKKQWSKFVDIEECVIANSRVNDFLKGLREFFMEVDAFHLKNKEGTFRFAVVRAPSKSSGILFGLNQDSKFLDEALEKIKEFSGKSSVEHIVVNYIPADDHAVYSEDSIVVKGENILKEEILSKTFYFSLQGFFQNNTEVSLLMHKYCRDVFEKEDSTEYELLDLYGGVGAFGLVNSDLFEKVTIIESVKAAIDCAQKNIEINSITNASARMLDAKSIGRLSFSDKLMVVCDPPRSGMDRRTIDALKQFKPDVMIYISCNVKQLGKDLVKFKEYSIKKAALFDLFPHTNHSEAIVVLKRK